MAPSTSGLKAGKHSSPLSISDGSQAVWRRRRRRNLPTMNEGEERKAEMGQDGGKTETH